jgi:choline dehydrogenase-like flavoprotein
MSPVPYAGYRGPLQLSGIDATREGDFRGERSALRLQVSHSVGNPQNAARQLIVQGIVGEQLFSQIGQVAQHQVRLASMLEQLPDPENRVLPDEQAVDAIGIPRPKLTYAIADYTNRGWESANALHDQMLQAIGATNVLHSEELGGVGHLIGTCRMGTDAATSVTDSFGRTHDHANLFLAGSSLFPTSGTANPTLTLSALALRAATHIASDFGVTLEGATPDPVATPA